MYNLYNMVSNKKKNLRHHILPAQVRSMCPTSNLIITAVHTSTSSGSRSRQGNVHVRACVVAGWSPTGSRPPTDRRSACSWPYHPRRPLNHDGDTSTNLVQMGVLRSVDVNYRDHDIEVMHIIRETDRPNLGLVRRGTCRGLDSYVQAVGIHLIYRTSRKYFFITARILPGTQARTMRPVPQISRSRWPISTTRRIPVCTRLALVSPSWLVGLLVFKATNRPTLGLFVATTHEKTPQPRRRHEHKRCADGGRPPSG